MSYDADQRFHELLQAGRQALARAAWEEARTCFEAAVALAELPCALEGLGLAAWWLSDAMVMFDARERAYRLYRDAGDRRGAARVAICLALDHYLFRGERAVSNGWFRRAHRLLEGLNPGPEHGMLAIWEGYVVLMLDNDIVTSRRLSSEAVALARTLRLIDIEMLALALEGLALVCAGEVDEGMRLLDEATTAATAGEMNDLDAIVTTCCFLISACELVRDFDRAAQWCRITQEMAERWSHRLEFSLCRTRYAGILMWRGAWAEAEAELTAATSELAETHPAMVAEGITRLAELRRRQGRLEEAAALLRQAELHPLRMLGAKPVLLGQAALALDRGDSAGAADLAGRFLRRVRPEDRLERIAGLELLVRAQIALGQHDQAADTLKTLRSILTAVPTPPLLALAGLLEGILEAASGSHQTARRHLEDAVDLFESSGAPYESALARLELARVLAALSRDDVAAHEARTALDTLQTIGAARQCDQAATFLRQLAAPRQSRTAKAGPLACLTPRELDVLRLVAQGMSDREVALTLTLSEHTVHRHISNILTKLELSSRAAAVARAAREGLL